MNIFTKELYSGVSKHLYVCYRKKKPSTNCIRRPMLNWVTWGVGVSWSWAPLMSTWNWPMLHCRRGVDRHNQQGQHIHFRQGTVDWLIKYICKTIFIASQLLDHWPLWNKEKVFHMCNELCLFTGHTCKHADKSEGRYNSSDSLTR